jgi:hypothetical protein
MPLVGSRCCHGARIDMVVTSHYAALPWWPARAVPASGVNQAQGINEP